MTSQDQILQNLYKKLKKLDCLKPSQNVNTIFQDLVQYVLNQKTEINISANTIDFIQKTCSKAEYELEKYWAQEIIHNKNPKKALQRFPYFQNYQQLTQLEWFSLLGCHHNHKHNFLFVGGGPLPLTALILAQKYQQTVTILEKEQEAVHLSQSLINILKMSEQIKIIHTDAQAYSDYGKYSVINIAALAGSALKEKTNIISRIHKYTKNDAHILARSSWGSRKILYKPFPKQDFLAPVLEIHPQNEIINSVLIFKKKETKFDF